MAHELLQDDKGNAAMFFVETKPWHGLGKELTDPPSAEEAIRAAGLDWEVAKAPLFYHTSITTTGIVPNRFALVPGKGWPYGERPMFGLVTKKYRILQNRQAFSFFDPLVTARHGTYETAGALGKGERVWVLAKLRGDFAVGKGDKIERYLLLSNSHDGHASVQVRFTPIRVVCQNTLTMALQDAGEVFAVRHDPSLFENLDAVCDEMMERIDGRYRGIETSFLEMLNRDMDGTAADEYFASVYPEPARPEADTKEAWDAYERAKGGIDRARWYCRQVFDRRRGADLPLDNLWGAYNAVTELVDRWVPQSIRTRSAAGHLNRIWFGPGYRDKVRAYEKALKLCEN